MIVSYVSWASSSTSKKQPTRQGRVKGGGVTPPYETIQIDRPCRMIAEEGVADGWTRERHMSTAGDAKVSDDASRHIQALACDVVGNLYIGRATGLTIVTTRGANVEVAFAGG